MEEGGRNGKERGREGVRGVQEWINRKQKELRNRKGEKE